MSKDSVIYEQPLNELVRACLRLEHLFLQLDTCLNSSDVDSLTQMIVPLIIDLLNLLDRPDLKAKLTTEFSRLIHYFSRLKNTPEISQHTLSSTEKKLKLLMTHFLHTSGKVAQPLRDNEFISTLRQCFMSPGGDSRVDAPAYFYFLSQPEIVHKKQIEIWLKQFQEIRSAIDLLLSIIRSSAERKNVMAEKGFYHQALNPLMPLQLIRVFIPHGIKLYPEISAGRHRMSLRFVIPNMDSRPRQTPDDVHFELSLCMI